MKWLLALIGLGGTITFSAAQGLITWNNSSSTLISYWFAPLAPATSPATTFYFGLFIAPYGTPAPWVLDWDDPNWENVVDYTINSTAAAGAGRLQNPGVATVPGYPPGSTINFIIRGWRSDTGGADWSAAKPGIWDINYAQSELGTVILGGGAFPSWNAFGTVRQPESGINQIGGFSFLIPIPEPSSLALVLAGVFSLCCARRRRPSSDVALRLNSTVPAWMALLNPQFLLDNNSIL